MAFTFYKMALFSHKEYLLKPDLTFKEVFNNLDKNIDSVDDSVFKYGFFSKIREQKFEGDLTDNQFTVQRVLNYRNPLLPEINGFIEEEDSKVVVYIEIRSELFPTIVFYVFSFLAIFIIIKNLFFDIDIQELVCALFMILFLIFGVINYNEECNQDIEDLKEILEIKD
ncbi:hypothetical protein OIU80_05735 [Flavobacterium sp. LS1R47]|uniref:Uncharacterized protein n=1 Tax=Flavobacterium frigoritolerans TaxID=2987686 RepID=A0A9X2ZQ56_9FLAO|nr:hypothetical protein [Flavobacterium frigoritolerans]MCV9931778.1 hypothetical protein [Flavobacterium frigoritolerans]